MNTMKGNRTVAWYASQNCATTTATMSHRGKGVTASAAPLVALPIWGWARAATRRRHLVCRAL
jgi:hypothetical protein